MSTAAASGQVGLEDPWLAAGAVADLASRAVDHGVRVGIDKLVDAVKVSLDKGRRERRAAGEAVIDVAKKMGR